MTNNGSAPTLTDDLTLVDAEDLTDASLHIVEMAELGCPIAMAAVAEGRLVRLCDLDI